ncbi:hypothetical protein SUGI_0297530 [Cryptomeria japonica]|nr:hypothetical protein SUGI_0297530 [Cryptomeria japonica]
MSDDGEEVRFRGVRKRKWGKYVAEIRQGKRSRISLGSYFTPQAAARAYDAALLCLRGPNASSFNFPDSQFNSTALLVAAAHRDPSPQVIRALAIDVGSASDASPARYYHNLEAGTSADRETSTYFDQGVSDPQTADRVEGEEDKCEANDTKYLLKSPEEISYEERVQMSLQLPEELEMMQPYSPSEIFTDLGTLDVTPFQATPSRLNNYTYKSKLLLFQARIRLSPLRRGSSSLAPNREDKRKQASLLPCDVMNAEIIILTIINEFALFGCPE